MKNPYFRIVLKVGDRVLTFRGCKHGQFTTKDRQRGDRLICRRCYLTKRAA
jgi:hypothetical protein